MVSSGDTIISNRNNRDIGLAGDPEVISSSLPGTESRFSAAFLLQALVAGVIIIVTLPIQGFIALMILVGSGLPVIYRGPRVGLDNSIFKLRKFRTLPDKYEYSVGSRLLTDKERNRSFLTKLIVRMKLDELPQLYNVVKGEMALVGPRPVRPALYTRYRKEIPHYGVKLRVRPGITGLAQIIGGYYMAPKDKHYYDVIYVQNKSLALDFKILALTFLALIFSRKIMKTDLVKRFLGLEMKVKSSHVEPPDEVVNEVTTSEENINENNGQQNVAVPERENVI